jgi:hypothetical protein
LRERLCSSAPGHFTPHETSHCQALENYADQIIWGSGALGPNDFLPTAEEAMYLLSAIWLHDIGMLYGIMDGKMTQLV